MKINPLEIWTLTIHIPSKIAVWLELLDEGNLPPDEQIEVAQFLIDCGLNEQLLQYQQPCDYFIAEGLCYDVQYEEESINNS